MIETQCCMELLLAMRNRFISRGLTGKNHGLIRNNKIKSIREKDNAVRLVRPERCIAPPASLSPENRLYRPLSITNNQFEPRFE